jgi:hypothetical protein
MLPQKKLWKRLEKPLNSYKRKQSMDNITVGFIAVFGFSVAVFAQILIAVVGEEIAKKILGTETSPGMIVGGIVADSIIATGLGILWLIGYLVNKVF